MITMGRFDYSAKISDTEEEKIARAIGRELRVSPKSSVEICRAVRKKNVEKAKEFLNEVVEMKRPVPMKKFKKGVAHRRGLEKAYAENIAIMVTEMPTFELVGKLYSLGVAGME